MTTHTQDTHPQDPIDRFTLRIEGLRRMPVPRGVAGVVHLMFVEFFIALWKALARFATQCRNGTPPEAVPAAAPGPSRTWPADLRPRESGWVQERSPEVAGSGTSHFTSHFRHSRAGGNPGCTMVVAAAGMDPRLRGNDGVLGFEQPEIIAPVVEAPAARPRGWPQWRELNEVGAASSRFDSKKSALVAVEMHVVFVTY